MSLSQPGIKGQFKGPSMAFIYIMLHFLLSYELSVESYLSSYMHV